MGVERPVTRWYLHRQLILDEISQLESKLAPSSVEIVALESKESALVEVAEVDSEAIVSQLEVARKKLKALGHCPKPMMG